MIFKKTFAKITQPNKSHKYIVEYAKDSTVIVEHSYNSISGTYIGVRVDGFVENIRGLLRTIPNFLDEVTIDPCKELLRIGFEERQPTDLEILMY